MDLLSNITLFGRNCKQDPDIWFEDGNVILQAETTCFRAHRSLMVANCQFFESVDSSSSQKLSVIAESPPIYHIIIEDHAFEFKILLLGIYNPNFYESPPAKVSMRDTISMTRMAYKYGADCLYQRALRHISLSFPTSLAKYDKVFQTTTISDLSSATVQDYMQLFASIRRKAACCMPAITYRCFCYRLENIMDTDAWKGLGDRYQRRIVRTHSKQSSAHRNIFKFYAYLPTS
ncbi:hypothetical protein BDZ97DRAFT_2006483 [Flammula alnicola]|nr:hypothetical protein BDZ97DRAFT_2006483 [Flammula alnicola]